MSGDTPTYVYPPSLKRVIREVIPGELVDLCDPNNERVRIFQSIDETRIPTLIISSENNFFLILSLPLGLQGKHCKPGCSKVACREKKEN